MFEDIYPTKELIKKLNSPSLYFYEAMQLIENGADVNATDKHGNTLLHFLAQSNKKGNLEDELVALVEKHGADINIKNHAGETPFQRFLNFHHKYFLCDGMLLLRMGSNVTDKDYNGDTFLHILAKSNKIFDLKKEICKLVKKYHADINALNSHGETPLQSFLNMNLHKYFSADDAMVLVHLGADISVKDKTGHTLLHVLARSNKKCHLQKEIEELVLKYGADINTVNNEGLTPLQSVLIRNHYPQEVFLLVKLGAQLSDLDKEKLSSLGQFFPEKIIDLVRTGISPNTQNPSGDSYLHILVSNNAAGHFNNDIVEIVGAGANLEIKNFQDETPLQCLMRNLILNLNTIVLLIRLGANPNKLDHNGDTMVHVLSRHNYRGIYNETFKSLTELGLNIDILNRHNESALQTLMYSPIENVHLAMHLIRSGANPDTKIANNQTYLNILSKHNVCNIYQKQIEYLQEISKEHKASRNNFLNFLIILANDRNNPSSQSFFKILPKVLVLHIISYLDYNQMNVDWETGVLMAKSIFKDAPKIKKMAKAPGGINISENYINKQVEPTFTLFKSATTLSQDYDALQKKMAVQSNQKNDFFAKIKRIILPDKIELRIKQCEKLAVKYYNDHSSQYRLFKKRKQLFDTVSVNELYKKPKINAKIKLN